jgi:hypothetical protein
VIEAVRDGGAASEAMSTQLPRSRTCAQASGRGGVDDDAEDEYEDKIGVEVSVGDSSSGMDDAVSVSVGMGLNDSSESVDDHAENRDTSREHGYFSVCTEHLESRGDSGNSTFASTRCVGAGKLRTAPNCASQTIGFDGRCSVCSISYA